jgi:tRNA threonylcarbamoyladenosine biosynthesis protein TsaE
MKEILTNKQYFLADESATIAVGEKLANIVKSQLNEGIIVYLYGDLGAGKTTLTRGFVQGMGHEGHVKSPTYTLVEPYELNDWLVYHFDLYRLSDPEELEYMGIRDYFANNCCCFIEWPEKGEGMIKEPDLRIDLAYSEEQRTINVQAKTLLGEQVLNELI